MANYRGASRPSSSPTAAHGPLPVYWTRRGKFYLCRISTLPTYFLTYWENNLSCLSALERAAVRAELGFRTLRRSF